jgi:hypothetical protein
MQLQLKRPLSRSQSPTLMADCDWEVGGYLGLVSSPWRSGRLSAIKVLPNQATHALGVPPSSWPGSGGVINPVAHSHDGFTSGLAPPKGACIGSCWWRRRKLIVELWCYITDGVVPEGAALKP